jgi:hypothetical protein
MTGVSDYQMRHWLVCDRASGLLKFVLLLVTLQAAAGHWSLQPLQAPEKPTTIDGYVMQRLREHGLEAAPLATGGELLRRLHLDVLGLPPTPEQIDAFLSDERPDAWAIRVDAVLASPHYGERWAQHWLDVVRYADTHGFEVNTPRPNAWPYRDWVIQALNADMPFPQFILAQLAGDQIGEDAATGFLITAPALLPGQIGKDEASIKQARQDQLNEIVTNTGSAFLGLTVSCARCHDHKFDPITQTDYHAMQAVFAGVHYGERDIEPQHSPDARQKIAQLRADIAQLEQQLATVEPLATDLQTIFIDDEDPTQVEFLTPPQPSKGNNPAGARRGYKDDPGGANWLPNISRGRYSWWANKPKRDLIAYRPGADGAFRIWLSWGCGWNTHATDARYLLDIDGDPTTRDDQKPLATINQQTFADGSD